ncbi:MAG: hypothetical protein ACYTFY_07720 [Planctomycetota bacterium]
MAINAVTGQRKAGLFPPQVIKRDIRINVTNNQQYNSPAHTRPQPRTAAGRKSVSYRSAGHQINFLF